MVPSFVHAIGSDRYLTASELGPVVGRSDAVGRAWTLYQRRFGGYCETGVDSQWWGVTNPVRDTGTLAMDAGQTVIVLGTGPSADRALPALRAVRDRVLVFTSPRGAEWMRGHGLTPDLVLVEHRTALDAHHAARHLVDLGSNPIADAPLVAVEWRTPPALLAGVEVDRLFVPDALPTWGLWPATAVAMAAQAGAARIGLVGIDLGTADQPDAGFAPMRELLELLGGVCGAEVFDAGVGGAVKAGWQAGALESFAPGQARSPLVVTRHRAPSREQRHAGLVTARRRMRPQVEHARRILGLAMAARAGRPVRGLQDAARDLLVWGQDPEIRVDLQEAMGLAFLPRLWRIGIDLGLGPALWRPLMLAAHELVGQAERLESRIRREAA